PRRLLHLLSGLAVLPSLHALLALADLLRQVLDVLLVLVVELLVVLVDLVLLAVGLVLVDLAFLLLLVDFFLPLLLVLVHLIQALLQLLQLLLQFGALLVGQVLLAVEVVQFLLGLLLLGLVQLGVGQLVLEVFLPRLVLQPAAQPLQLVGGVGHVAACHGRIQFALGGLRLVAFLAFEAGLLFQVVADGLGPVGVFLLLLLDCLFQFHRLLDALLHLVG